MITLDAQYIHNYVEKKELVLEMWTRFIRGEPVDSGLLPISILSSWKRSYEYKVDPYLTKINCSVASDFEERLSAKKQLLDIAIPYLTGFYKITEDSDFVFIVTDENGLILEIIGNSKLIQQMKDYNVVPGMYMEEKTFGTTAVVLALLHNKSVQIVATEHFCKIFHPFTCSAAPIHNFKGKIIGLIMILALWEKAHPHTLGMVTSTANAIETLVALNEEKQNVQLVSNFQNTIIESFGSSLLVVDNLGKITHVNSHAVELLELAEDEIRGSKIESISTELGIIYEVLKRQEEKIVEHGVTIYTKNRVIDFSLSCYPVNHQGKTIGAIVILREPELVKKIVNRTAHSNAKFVFSDIIGQNENLLKAINLAKTASKSSSSVLLLGESGSGKELFAQAIHNASLRRNGPFISVNCAAIPRELLGTELFGYEEGAFTGAKKGGNFGKFELAHNGTIFLDEIGEMPLEMQIILLRVLEDKKVTRIGGARSIPVDVRVIAATNRKLREDALTGRFRLDLFFRLNVLNIELPPLRERKDDIPLLVDNFILRYSTSLGKKIRGITPEALEELCNYNWPGNIRELSNVIERAVHITSSCYIGVKDLPEEVRSCNSNLSNREILSIRNYEKEMIIQLLTHFKGNKTKVASELGISRATLYRHLEKFRIMEG
ncbi:MAG: sigma 54-interacting transcriptional regulator [Bacillota bacterium]|nr:sigma 54-interacting transcriptional regulator [Bacillota bacterium]